MCCNICLLVCLHWTQIKTKLVGKNIKQSSINMLKCPVDLDYIMWGRSDYNFENRLIDVVKVDPNRRETLHYFI